MLYPCIATISARGRRLRPMKAENANKPQELSPVLVRVEDVANALSVSKRQVGYWVEENQIPSHKLKGTRARRFHLPSVLKALEIQLND